MRDRLQIVSIFINNPLRERKEGKVCVLERRNKDTVETNIKKHNSCRYVALLAQMLKC